jgi:hypothetical protein
MLSISSISATPSIPVKSFYSLRESVQFESRSDVKIVYFTEKGINLFEAVPEFAMVEQAMRRGYSWATLMELDDSIPRSNNKHVVIVKTTEAELAAHGTVAIDHKSQLLGRIDTLPTSEWSHERIADMIVNYMLENNITDFDLSNTVCEIIGNKLSAMNVMKHKSDMLARITALSDKDITKDACVDMIVDYMTEHHITDFAISDEVCEILVSKGYIRSSPDASLADAYTITDDSQADASQADASTISQGLSTISGWLVTSFDSVCTSIQHLTLNILPIPSNMDWIMLD